ncbi:Glutamate receptor 3.2 [Glycine max]|nr:Glutamate receptor 3.2 [Glycine max]
MTDTVAIIRPQTSVMAHVLSHLPNELHVPLLYSTALDPTLTTSPVSLFSPPTSLFTDDDQSRNGITVLGDKLAQRSCKLSFKAPLPLDTTATPTHVTSQLLKIKSMESRVIVLSSFAQTWNDDQRLCLDSYCLNGTVSFSNNTYLSGTKKETLDFGALSVFDGGKQLLDNILSINMSGLTGPIQFGSDRSPLNPSCVILNVIATEIKLASRASTSRSLRKKKRIAQGKYSIRLSLSSYEGQDTIKQCMEGIKFLAQGKLLDGEAGEDFFKFQGRFRRGGVGHKHESTRMLGAEIKLASRASTSRSLRKKKRIAQGISYRDMVSQINGHNAVQGCCIDIFLAAIKLLPYAVQYKFILFGDGHKNPSYYDLVNMITYDVFDAVVGDIAIVTDRTKIVDFTQPYIEFSFSTMFFANRKSSIHSDRENTVSSLGRVELIIWLFVVLIINSSYTASLTSILTVQQLCSPITRIDSLIFSSERIGFQVGSFAANYLTEQLNIPKHRLIPLGSSEEYAVAFQSRTLATVVDERPYAFPRDSPLAIDMSTAILTLSENAELQRIQEKWLSEKACGFHSTEDEQLQLNSFRGLFLICEITCFLALLTYFFLSMVRQFSKKSPQKVGPSNRCSSRSAHIQTFLHFVDEKEDVSPKKLKRKLV